MTHILENFEFSCNDGCFGRDKEKTPRILLLDSRCPMKMMKISNNRKFLYCKGLPLGCLGNQYWFLINGSKSIVSKVNSGLSLQSP